MIGIGKKKYFKWIIILAIIIPFPTKAFHSFRISLIDEVGYPIANASGLYSYCMYPSLKTKEISFTLDKNGEAFLKGQNVWMNFILRIGYASLSLLSRSGWSSMHSNLDITIAHRNFEGQIRIAKLITPKMDYEQASFDSKLRFGGVSYYKGNRGPLFFIDTDVNENEDSIKLTIIGSRDSIIENIKLELFVLSPKLDRLGNLIENSNSEDSQ